MRTQLIVVPLWIGRCCAHRCLPPRNKTGRFRTRTQCVSSGCCLLFGLGILAAAVSGAVSPTSVDAGLRGYLCTLHLEFAELQVL